MDGFRRQREKVPEHIGILKIVTWVSFLGVNKVREFKWVVDEENGGIVPGHVIVALFRVELEVWVLHVGI